MFIDPADLLSRSALKFHKTGVWSGATPSVRWPTSAEKTCRSVVRASNSALWRPLAADHTACGVDLVEMARQRCQLCFLGLRTKTPPITTASRSIPSPTTWLVSGSPSPSSSTLTSPRSLAFSIQSHLPSNIVPRIFINLFMSHSRHLQ